MKNKTCSLILILCLFSGVAIAEWVPPPIKLEIKSSKLIVIAEATQVKESKSDQDFFFPDIVVTLKIDRVLKNKFKDLDLAAGDRILFHDIKWEDGGHQYVGQNGIWMFKNIDEKRKMFKLTTIDSFYHIDKLININRIIKNDE